MAVRPDGRRLATISAGGQLAIWDTTTEQQIGTRAWPGGVKYLSYSPDGKFLAGGREKLIAIRDTGNLNTTLNLGGHTDAVTSVVYNPDGTKLVSGSKDGTIRIWNAIDGTPLHTISEHTGAVLDVAFSPDGKRIVSSSVDKSVRVLDVESATQLSLFETPERDGRIAREVSNASCFSPSGKWIASGYRGGRIIVWDAESQKIIWDVKGHNGGMSRLIFSPDGNRLASTGAAGGMGVAKLWDAATGEAVLKLSGSKEPFINIQFSPSGKQLFTLAKNGKLNIWDSRPWTPEQRVQLQARGYLKVHRERHDTLENLVTYIQNDKTINEEVRQQCLIWVPAFWKNRQRASG